MKGMRKRAAPLPAEVEQQILAEVQAEIERAEEVWWVVGLPVPEPVEWDDDYGEDDDDLPL